MRDWAGVGKGGGKGLSATFSCHSQAEGGVVLVEFVGVLL